jgi:hypothetical protein
MEFVKKYSILIGVFIFLGGIAAGLIKYGEDKQSIFSRTFTSPDEKVRVVKYVEESPSPKDQWREYYRDSINVDGAMRARAENDSMIKIIIERMDRKDSLDLLDADQLYQMKEEVKDIKQTLRLN